MASFLIGCSLTLSSLATGLWRALFSGFNACGTIDEAAVRNCIIELGARRSFAAKGAHLVLYQLNVNIKIQILHLPMALYEISSKCEMHLLEVKKISHKLIEGMPLYKLPACMTVGGHAYGTGASEGIDSLNDDSPELLWQWELRSIKSAPKHLQPVATQRKKLLRGVRCPAAIF